MATIDVTPANVAALLRARTKDQGGRELGEWTDETRPTLTQVDEAITLAEADRRGARSARPSTLARARSPSPSCIEAACMIEKSYFPSRSSRGARTTTNCAPRPTRCYEGVRECQAGNLPDGDEASERTWQVYDVCTPAGAGCGASCAGRSTGGNATSKTRCRDRVYVTGEEQLRADLRGMARAAHDLEPVLERQARRTAEAIGGVPRGRSGRLGEGVKSPKNRRVTGSGFEIGVGTFYGHMVFGGHEPFGRRSRPNIPGDVGRETARLIGDYIVRHRHGVA